MYKREQKSSFYPESGTGDRGTRRGSCPGRRPWPCGDRAGVLAALEGGVVVTVEGPVLLRGVAPSRGSCRRGS
jgi:hypothetical protein